MDLANPKAIDADTAEKVPNGNTTHAYATIPYTIDGIPCNVSIEIRTTSESFDVCSDKYSPIKTPIGIDNKDAPNTIINVPTIAFDAPPPSSPTGFGKDVKKSIFILVIPFFTM